MQRIGNLYDQLCSFSNLYLAWQKTRRGSGRSVERATYFMVLETELLDLQEKLLAENWEPAPFRYFDIYDPKHRTIAVAEFRDRVMHHALVNVLEPIYEKSFIADSFATRKGKGVHSAVYRAQHFLRQNEFFLKTDVEKFFDSVDHQILCEILARKIKDPKLIRVCEKVIRGGGSGGKGLPIGNRTSQFFANVYLDQLDHLIKDRMGVKGYVRYMDDFVIFGNDKTELHHIKSTIIPFLDQELKLGLKPSATLLNRRQHGLPFLGRRIFPQLIRLRTENLRRITQRLTHKEYLFRNGEIDEATFQYSMNSYWAMLSYDQDLAPLRKSLLW
jgi:retron-type reverse transcriptase